MKKTIQIEEAQIVKKPKVYTELYFGIGLGFTSITEDCIVIILPFVMIMISKDPG